MTESAAYQKWLSDKRRNEELAGEIATLRAEVDLLKATLDKAPQFKGAPLPYCETLSASQDFIAEGMEAAAVISDETHHDADGREIAEAIRSAIARRKIQCSISERASGS